MDLNLKIVYTTNKNHADQNHKKITSIIAILKRLSTCKSGKKENFASFRRESKLIYITKSAEVPQQHKENYWVIQPFHSWLYTWRKWCQEGRESSAHPCHYKTKKWKQLKHLDKVEVERLILNVDRTIPWAGVPCRTKRAQVKHQHPLLSASCECNETSCRPFPLQRAVWSKWAKANPSFFNLCFVRCFIAPAMKWLTGLSFQISLDVGLCL